MASRRRTDAVFADFARYGWDVKGWAPRTRQHYYETVASADRWLVENRGVSLMWATTKDLQAWLFAKPPNARTRNNARQALVGFGDFLMWRELRHDNPARPLPRLPQPRPLPRPLEPEQSRRLAATARVAGGVGEPLVLLPLYTGARHSEMRLLEWRQVADLGWVRFWGKGAKERDLPIHAHLGDALTRWRMASRDPRWVFPSTRHVGRPMSESMVRQVVREVGEVAGITRLVPHVLRHTFATELMEVTGGDLRLVQAALGHEDPRTTVIYTKVRSKRMRDAVAKLEFMGGESASQSGREP